MADGGRMLESSPVICTVPTDPSRMFLIFWVISVTVNGLLVGLSMMALYYNSERMGKWSVAIGIVLYPEFTSLFS